jgi:hypothetical protein
MAPLQVQVIQKVSLVFDEGSESRNWREQEPLSLDLVEGPWVLRCLKNRQDRGADRLLSVVVRLRVAQLPLASI